MIIFLALTKARAEGEGFSIGPSFIYLSDEYGQSTKAESKIMAFDIRLGMTSAAGIFLGGKYFNYTREVGASEQNPSGYGPTLGYNASGFYTMLTYIMESEDQHQGGTKYESGSGLNFDIGYVYMMGAVGVGAQLNYYALEYDEVTTAGTAGTANPTYERSMIFPSIALSFAF
jgi:hypothetical protein